MAVWLTEKSKVVVQGLTGKQGQFYGLRNKAYGTNIVAGVNPKKAGENVEGIPVFATVADAVKETGADISFIIVPASIAADAILEAAKGGVGLIVCVTEHIPAHDQARVYNTLKRDYPTIRLLGPNCAGILSPGKANIGFTPTEVALGGGPVGIVSRSGTLAYQALYELTAEGIGQTTCVGIGGDPVPGTSFIDVLKAFQDDDETKAIVLIGEIGGSAEEEAAEYIKANITKPVVAYIGGVSAPPGKKMGHAGAIVSKGKGTAQAKMKALTEAGAKVANNPTEIGGLVLEALKEIGLR
ncbi:MAG: succinate--CoA ligase subunit alpha [Phototrophicales bacterium]|nr:succinate--CoA ligase subunit alpha [Phototrophicales bacterium]